MVQTQYLNLFLRKLHDLSKVDETQEDFIRDLTFTIVLDLSKKSYIPTAHRLELFEEIEAEVIEIYRKKTYGFICLSDFRRSLLNKLTG